MLLPSKESCAGFVCFTKRIMAFMYSLKHLDEYEKKDLIVELVRFSLQVNNRYRYVPLKKKAFKYGVLEDIRNFKTQYIDVSHYIHRTLWKAVVQHLNGQPYGDDKNLQVDVEFCMQHLSEADCKELKNKPINDNHDVDGLELGEWEFGKRSKKGLMEYAASKIHKMNFLASDPALDKEDLVQDILCEIVRIFNTYQRTAKPSDDNEPLQTKVSKYIDKSLGNKIKSIIEYHTFSRRKFLRSANDEIYDQIRKTKTKLNKARKDGKVEKVAELNEKLESLQAKISKSDQDYFTTTVSIDHTDETMQISSDYQTEKSSSYSYNEPNLMDDAIWIETIKKEVTDQRILDFIRIVIEGDSDFEQWSESNNLKTDKFNSMYTSAKKYLREKNSTADQKRKWNPKSMRYDEDLLRCFNGVS